MAKYYIDKVAGTWRYKVDAWPTASDTAASLNTIQGCLNDLDGAGNTVIIPPKTYAISDVSASGLFVSGSTNTTFQAPQSDDIAYPGYSGDVVFDATGASGTFFYITQAGWTVKNIKIQNLATNGAYAFRGSQPVTVDDITIDNCNRAFLLAGGTINRPKVTRIFGSTHSAFVTAGTITTFNYPIFDGSLAPINLGNAANTIVFNNPIFTRFDGTVFVGNVLAFTVTFNNALIFGNILHSNSSNLHICASNGFGTWTFNNCYLGGNSRYLNAFFSNPGSTATVTYNNTVSDLPSIASNWDEGKTFFITDDSENYNAFKSLAALAETYGHRAGLAVSWYGSVNVNFAELSTYILAGHEVCGHCHSATELGTPNAFTAAKAGTTLTIEVTRTDPDDSSTWTGTLTVSGNAAINLASTDYNTMRKVAVYLASVGVTMGQATGQINYATISVGYEANPLCLASAVYDIATVKTVLYDEPSLFQYEIKEAKAWLESQIQPHILGWTAKSLVWPVGSHSTNSRAYALGAGGYQQARGISSDYSDFSALDMGKVAAVIVANIGGTTYAERLAAAHNFLATMAQAGYVCGVYSHGYVEAEWEPLFDALAAGVSEVSADTFSGVMDWVRANDDHVTGAISYRCSAETNSCLGTADYQLKPGSAGIDAGVTISGVTSDFLGNPIYKQPDIGAYEYQYTTGFAAVEFPGPFGIDGPFTGTVFPTGNFQAPLGAEFQDIDTFTGEAEVDLETLVPTDYVRTGPKGMLIYRTARDAAGILRADKVVGITSAWFELMFEDGSAYTFEEGSPFELHGD